MAQGSAGNVQGCWRGRYDAPSSTTNVWHLAYGSNLSSSKLIRDRGIRPLASIIVTAPGHVLAMNSAGVPYSEPAFASILPIHPTAGGKYVQLIGIAYLLTPEMYLRLVASGGGGIAYAEIEASAEELAEESAEKERVCIRKLIREGAGESGMPPAYQKYLAKLPTYQPPEQGFRKVGAQLFLAFWVPVMALMERITKASLVGGREEAPIWVITLVRTVVWVMWFHHDYLHAPIWGRGDGLDEFISVEALNSIRRSLYVS
ncbi:hypothetical protein BCR34DRAFT_628339 [Clohesyomyces aquaticus]|uniref:Uncharacterized protein n=1 Tax=Clohesyomyces aquaticus TaxID=1231657 RepID=A0A1Y1YKZ8_9PLEO|nr:hypothetical protein BCR34DRAFT_628339 [Clohesyomyces aquaticus]